MESFRKPWAGLVVCLALAAGCGQTARPEAPEAVGTGARALMTFSRPAELVRDINPRPVPGAGSFPGDLTVMGGTLYFSASSSALGSELWRSDGTSEGTVCLDAVPGTGGVGPSNVTEMNGTLFFEAGVKGLWKSDGTAAGTVSVKDIPNVSSGLDRLTNVGGTLFFLAGSESGKPARLWKSDGTGAGTVRVKDIQVLPFNTHVRSLTHAGGRVFFGVTDAVMGQEPWVSDGTEAGTKLLKDLVPGAGHSLPRELTGVGATLFFAADDASGKRLLWKSDGTEAGTVPVPAPSRLSSPLHLAAMNGVLYFQAYHSDYGIELWRTDGTAAGTMLVKNIAGGSANSMPESLTAVGSTLYFTATTVTTGTELWKSDGTEAGTVLVKDFTPGTAGSTFTHMTAVGGTLYFTANDGTSGVEVWKSDGTAAGTVRVKDILPGTASASPESLTEVNGQLAFIADDPATGSEVWWSDGTEAGTRILKDIAGPNAGSSPNTFVQLGEALLFFAFDGVSGTELWRTDGTAAGTSRVKDVNPGAGSARDTSSLYNTYYQRVVGSTLYFTADDGSSGTELWKTDGTAAGTMLVKDLQPGWPSSSVTPVGELGGTLFLSAIEDTRGRELWKTDGTAGGTVLVKDINPGTGYGVERIEFVELGGRLYFSGNDGSSGGELWKSDGTAGGTVRVKDIRAGTTGSLPQSFQVMNGVVYFAAEDGLSGQELWRSDGTEAGTYRVKDIYSGSGSGYPNSMRVMNGTLFFIATTGANSRELWKSDGTEAGTVMVKDINPGTGDANPSTPIPVGGLVYFTANDGSSGHELWRSDGTEAGTVLVKDIRPGSASSGLFFIQRLGGRLFFMANDGTSGDELWVTDGTKAGTVLVKDIRPGAEGSTLRDMYPLEPEGLMVFTATGPGSRELWVSDGTAAGTRPVTDLKNVWGTLGNPSLPVRLGDRLLFIANARELGMELWSLPPGPPPDTTPPTLVCPPVHEVEATGPEGAVVLAVDVTVSDAVTASPVVRYSPALGTVFPLGSSALTVTAEDDAGNTGTCAINVRVRDTTAPVPTCPEAMTEEATGPTGALVSYPPASAVEAVSAASFSYSKESGTVFPLGSTTVTATARDAADNAASCGFTVTVRDTTPPRVGCPGNLVAEAQDASGADVAFLLARPSDEVTREPVVNLSHAPGSRYPLGTTPISVTATDDAGNAASCGFTVTVRDGTAPVLVCPADVTVEAGVGEGAPVTFSPATASDAVTATLEVAYSHVSGSHFPAGTTRVTASTVDGAGLRAECSFQVTVRNAAPPPVPVDPERPPVVVEPVGCACSAPGAGGSEPGPVLWLLLGAGMLWSGRRRGAWR